MAKPKGLEPSVATVTGWCINQLCYGSIPNNILIYKKFSKNISKLAGAARIELASKVLETPILPLNYAPNKNGGCGRNRTFLPVAGGKDHLCIYDVDNIMYCA